MIADAFILQSEAIPYPDRTDYSDRSEYARARLAEAVAHDEVNRAFGVALADEYLSTIAESRRQAIGERTFALAWEQGHSSGYRDVENCYIDFASFAEAVYAAATS